MKRDELASRARSLVPANGFVLETATATRTIKKALSLLAREGRVESPRTGWWRIARSDSAIGEQVENGNRQASESDTEEQELVATEVAESTSGITVEREIGKGPESVYVYYHDAHANLAQQNGSSVWECKVGWTIGEPDSRVIGQGALTAFPRPPIIGLVIKTEDGRRLEHALHSALTLAGKRVKGGGSEWFMTSPEQIELWVQAFWNSLTIFDSLRDSRIERS